MRPFFWAFLAVAFITHLVLLGIHLQATTVHTRRTDLLYVEIRVPAGYTVQFLSRHGASVTYKAATTFGLRPGYGYWLRLRGPAPEREEFYPLLEVLDTLSLPSQARASDVPAVVAINELDLDRVRGGDMVSKVIVVEQDVSLPDGAIETNAPTVSAEVENEVMSGTDLVRYASRYGRPLVILRLGSRRLEPQEWSQPPVPLTGAAASWSRQHRQLDRERPSDSAGFIREGGDLGESAYRTPEGQLGGVEPGDTVAEFTDRGRRRLTTANPVTLAAPRFLTFYQLHGLGRIRSEWGLQPITSPAGRETVIQHQHLQLTRLQQETEHLNGRTQLLAQQAHLPTLRIAGAQELGATRVELPGPQAVSVPITTESVTWLGFDPSADRQQVPLRLQKWASAHAARPGDVITFYLRYTNTSNRLLSDIAITDSLSPRLEYVPGSARSDREAVFVLQENQAGGRILRWEIRDPLPPGQNGTISFQVRVR
ncbi:MAG: hypothetical protein RMI91_10700 [Gemmatales bacterium]|nr:hypothetical protein [Gemmatales bacterium]MDW7995112.1 hypothetical protein [Gemmatales bacterium]